MVLRHDEGAESRPLPPCQLFPVDRRRSRHARHRQRHRRARQGRLAQGAQLRRLQQKNRQARLAVESARRKHHRRAMVQPYACHDRRQIAGHLSRRRRCHLLLRAGNRQADLEMRLQSDAQKKGLASSTTTSSPPRSSSATGSYVGMGFGAGRPQGHRAPAISCAWTSPSKATSRRKATTRKTRPTRSPPWCGRSAA